MVRPSIFDYKYKDLSSNERFIQAERDQMLYDLTYGKQQINYFQPTTTTQKSKRNKAYYMKDIDNIIKADSIKQKPKLDKTTRLKEQYASLKALQYNNTKKPTDVDLIRLSGILFGPILIFIMATSDLVSYLPIAISITLFMIFGNSIKQNIIINYTSYEMKKIRKQLNKKTNK